jgi:hypothetical protein
VGNNGDNVAIADLKKAAECIGGPVGYSFRELAMILERLARMDLSVKGREELVSSLISSLSETDKVLSGCYGVTLPRTVYADARHVIHNQASVYNLARELAVFASIICKRQGHNCK